MLRGISISSTWFTCSGTILIRRATDAPLATLKSAVSFDFLNGCRFDFLSLSPDLTSCPDRSTLFFLFQVVVTRGGMRRSASPRDAPHRIRSFLPLRLGFSSTWPTATRGNAGFNLEHYLTGKLRPKPENIGPMALRSKEPAPEERGDVKFLHVGLLLLGQPEASSGKEQAAVRGRCSRCWPAGCRSGSWS